MAGIYIHIPFCKQACHYCNFHFSTNTQRTDEVIDAIVTELDLRRDYLSNDLTINTIYFGGGTPSLLNEKQISKILDKVYQSFHVIKNPEITLEANPDDLSVSKLKTLFKAGVNRLSIGVQSFFDSELQMMNRVHCAHESSSSVKSAQDIGITNISIDLIFGIQESTLATWETNLITAIDLNVPHMSCYNLTVEPKTALAHMVKTGKISDVDDNLSAQQFGMTMKVLGAAQYDHYEISNYAKDGLLSNHNTNYWQSVPYLGVGPSAHSYDGNNRAWNIANNALYLQSLKLKDSSLTEEVLKPEDRINEYIMTGLRTKWGCSTHKMETIMPGSSSMILASGQPFIEKGLVSLSNDVLQLSQEGKYYADQIASDLFIV